MKLLLYLKERTLQGTGSLQTAKLGYVCVIASLKSLGLPAQTTHTTESLPERKQCGRLRPLGLFLQHSCLLVKVAHDHFSRVWRNQKGASIGHGTSERDFVSAAVALGYKATAICSGPVSAGGSLTCRRTHQEKDEWQGHQRVKRPCMLCKQSCSASSAIKRFGLAC